MEQNRINEKISYLKEIIEYIKRITSGDKKEILTNKLIMDSLENNIRKAIQVMIDLASDIVSKNKLRTMYYILSNISSFSRKRLFIKRKFRHI